ncbi:MAG: fibronectin type III domain-containing protein, partial [Deltaproteobacteria bacterium]|nr:fibronectin type III domain-containing protein [Deltaproteobacteria bacterium]
MTKAIAITLVVSAITWIGCDPTRDGPTPKPTGIAPNEICTACGDNIVQISGSGFSPAVKGPLTDGKELEMPRVWLVAPDGAENEISPATVTLAKAEGEGQVLSCTIPFQSVGPTESGAESVSYDIKIRNPNGNVGWLRAADGNGLTVVAPTYYDLLRIEPPFGWQDTDTTVTIFSNEGFVSTPTAYMIMHDDDPEAEHDRIDFEHVAFIDSSTITAVVPAGAELGTYDVYVVNPDPSNAIGVLESGFTVVDEPVPTVIWVVPNRGSTQNDTDVTIYGANFRDPVQVELLDEELQAAVTIDSVTPISDSEIQTTFPTSTMDVGVYLVRVTNLDEMSYGSWAAFLVTNPAGNLNDFEGSSGLTTGRRMLAGCFANDDFGNRYVMAIGGDTGDGGEVLDTVELAHDSDGSPWIPVKTYVYVVGGFSDSGEVLDTVEVAAMLTATEAPVITSAEASTEAGTLDAGSWYYMVSAVLDADDPDNPGGETAASDEAVVTLLEDGAITVSWDALTVNGQPAVAYRVYRTDEVDGASWTEHMIAEVTDTSYTDTGETAGTESPNAPGSTGVFTVLSETMGSGRWGHQALLTHDENGDRYLYVLGGKDAEAGGYLDSAEWAPLDENGLMGGFETTGSTAIDYPRAFFSAVVEDQSNINTFPSDGSRIWAMGGVTDGDTTNTLEESDIANGGGNGAWTENGHSVQDAAGTMAVITNNKLFIVGGATNVDDTSFDNITPNGRDTEFDENGDITGSINSTASSLLEPR